jgi:amino acid adenylation domain-containing protein
MKNSIYNYFVETANRNCNEVAIIDSEETWTFSRLQAAVNILMDKMLCANAPPTNSIIAVLLKKSAQAVIADISITGIGCAYMNLDAKSPPSRIKKILNTVSPAMVITDAGGMSLLNKISHFTTPITIIDEVDFLSLESRLEISDLLLARLNSILDVDPYCVINTSGSTGTPKGVVLNHRSFIDFMNWSEGEFGAKGDAVVGSLSPIIFDIFSYELCMLIFWGTSLRLIDERLAPYPAKILEILERDNVSFIFWVPTIMVNIANLGLLDKFSLPNLRTVWFAGEVFPTIHFNKWYDKFPEVCFVNLYGPIEITLDCTYFIVKDRISNDQPIPIGTACRNTGLLVLNNDGQKTKDGEVGELYVRGTSLAMGYYNNPEQTAKAFIQNPTNLSYPEIVYKTGDLVVRNGGLLYFKGRADTMIKHLGYRIELAEIEQIILSAIPQIMNCCVIYSHARKEIVAYCECSGSLDYKLFRSSLANELPSYMLPSSLVIVEEMPMNANGKIDRLRFKEAADQ